LRQAALDLIAKYVTHDAVPLEEMLARAGVDRAWFDRRFPDKGQCLLWASAVEIRLFTDHLWDVYEAQSSWREGLRAVGYALADLIAADPRFPVVCTVAIGYAGDLAQLERDTSLQRLADMVDLGRQEMDDPALIGREAAEATVGAIFSTLRAAASVGTVDDPVAVVPQFMFMAIRPYLGVEAAREELATPRPA
jgi:AcrR family transcriptional regulator